MGAGFVVLATLAFIAAGRYESDAAALVGCAALCGVFIVHQVYVWDGDFRVPARLGLCFAVVALVAAFVQVVSK
jgi:hypothetical protein